MTTSGFESAEHAEQAFYDAMRAADAVALANVWANEDEIICIHPHGPRLIGFEQVCASWNAILEGGPIEVQISQQHCTVGDALAVHSVMEEITIRGERNSETVHCFATNVYALTPEGWQLILHQAAPAQEEPVPLARTNEVLH